MAPNRPTCSPMASFVSASRRVYGRPTTPDGEAIGPPHGEEPVYQSRGSVMAPWLMIDCCRSLLTVTRRSPSTSPGLSALRILSSAGSAGRRSRSRSADGASGFPTAAVPSATSVSPPVVAQARTCTSRSPVGGRSMNACTGSPSVVACRKYRTGCPSRTSAARMPGPVAAGTGPGGRCLPRCRRGTRARLRSRHHGCCR